MSLITPILQGASALLLAVLITEPAPAIQNSPTGNSTPNHVSVLQDGDGTINENYPEFSWDTIPRWVVLRSRFYISDDAVQRIGNNYSLAMLEKSNSQGFDFTETGYADLSPRLKNINPDIVNLPYWNSFYSWPGYEAGLEFLENEAAWSRDPIGTTGRIRLETGNVDMQQWWVRIAIGLNNIPTVDGLFIDTLRSGARPMVAELHEQLPSSALTVANGTFRESYWLDYFDGSYLEGWIGDGDTVASFITRSRGESNRGEKVILFRGQADHGSRFTGEEQPDNLSDQLDWVERHVEYPLAVFLMIAEENSFFRYGTGVFARTGENSSNHIWDTSYMDIFSRPLGPPLGDPVVNGFVHSRSFQYLDVSVNVDTGETSFLWKPVVNNLGDVDLDGAVTFSDIQPFIAVLSTGTFQAEADCDENGVVDFSDISAFIAILSG